MFSQHFCNFISNTHTERCKTFNFTSTCSHFLHASAFVIASSVHRQRKVWWHRCCCSASCTQFSCYCTHSMFTCTALFHSFIRFLCKQNVMFLKHDMCCIANSSTLNETKNFLFFSPSSQLSIFARKKNCFKMKTLCKFHAESKSHAEWEKIVYEIALNVRDFASSYCWKCNSNKLNSFIEHKVLRWNVSMANDSTIFLSLSFGLAVYVLGWLRFARYSHTSYIHFNVHSLEKVIPLTNTFLLLPCVRIWRQKNQQGNEIFIAFYRMLPKGAIRRKSKVLGHL